MIEDAATVYAPIAPPVDGMSKAASVSKTPYSVSGQKLNQRRTDWKNKEKRVGHVRMHPWLDRWLPDQLEHTDTCSTAPVALFLMACFTQHASTFEPSSL